VHPSIAETAFTCPHCHALTTQQWFSVTASRLDDRRTPAVWTLNFIEKVDALKKKALTLKSGAELQSLGQSCAVPSRGSVSPSGEERQLRVLVRTQCFSLRVLQLSRVRRLDL
jgi:hypothetical protein